MFEKILSRIDDFINGKLIRKTTRNEEEEIGRINQGQGIISPPKEFLSPKHFSHNQSFEMQNVNNKMSNPNQVNQIGSVFPEKNPLLKMETANSFVLIIEGDVIHNIFSSAENIQQLLKIIPYCR